MFNVTSQLKSLVLTGVALIANSIPSLITEPELIEERIEPLALDKRGEAIWLDVSLL